MLLVRNVDPETLSKQLNVRHLSKLGEVGEEDVGVQDSRPAGVVVTRNNPLTYISCRRVVWLTHIQRMCVRTPIYERYDACKCTNEGTITGNFVGTEPKTKGRSTFGIFEILHETKLEPAGTYNMD